MTDIEKAKNIYKNGANTCVLARGDSIFTSCERGVKPLVGFIDGGRNFAGFSAADKIVGRAAAFLYIILGVKEVYADVMSEGAEKLLKAHNIGHSCGVTVQKIINRAGDGQCPMELAVAQIKEPEAALAAIKAKISELKIS